MREKVLKKPGQRDQMWVSPACVLVPSPVWGLSACDLWHWDWEQSSLPAQYCYNWQLMRLDGLSSTALNRGLQLHESRALLFLPPFFFLLPFISTSKVAAVVWRDIWGCGEENKAGRQRYMSGVRLLQRFHSSFCTPLKQRLSSWTWGETQRGDSDYFLHFVFEAKLLAWLCGSSPVFRVWSSQCPCSKRVICVRL